jgi:hypothetical protein
MVNAYNTSLRIALPPVCHKNATNPRRKDAETCRQEKIFKKPGHFKKVWKKLLNFPGQWVIIARLK